MPKQSPFLHSDSSIWITALAILLSGTPVLSQVHIREQVEITADSSGFFPSFDASTGEAIWVASRGGVAIIRVFSAFQILTPISAVAHFQVNTPDTSYTGNVVEWASETVYYGPDDFYDWCAQTPFSGTEHYIRGIIPYDRSLFITIGAEGDTLRFSYTADGTNEMSDVGNPIGLWTNHPCLADLYGDNRWYACYLTIAYADTEHVRFDVESLKDTLEYGDSLEVRAIALSIDDNETPLEENPGLCVRLSPDDIGHFITAGGEHVSSPLENVPYMEVREGKVQFIADGITPDSTQKVIIEVLQMNDTTKRGSDTVWVEPKIIKILLGETKFFQVDSTQEGKLRIKEVPDSLKETGLPGRIADNSIWGTTPLSVLRDADTSAYRVGLYWDFKWATIRTDTLEPIMNNLPDGLIRVIGRYWTRDSLSQVKLQAQYQGKSEDVVIEVKRPNQLGTTNHTVTGPTVLNGVDSTWNLDSLIIEVAGREGILPQIVKGIIRKESINFHPSYRYEPFTDLMIIQQLGGSFDSTSRYWIRSESNLGDPTIPQHNNIRIAIGPDGQVIQYPGYRTVWDYYSEYDSSLYTRRWYQSQEDQWKTFFEQFRDSLRDSGLDMVVAMAQSQPLADERYRLWLRNEIGGLGMVGTIAQTRIAASYGLMQLTYFGGAVPRRQFITWGYNYPNNDASFLPEYINIPRNGLRYGVLHLKGWLRLALGGALFTENTWSQGLEYSYWWGLKGYNGSKTYPNPVFGHANIYPPKED